MTDNNIPILTCDLKNLITSLKANGKTAVVTNTTGMINEAISDQGNPYDDDCVESDKCRGCAKLSQKENISSDN